ncbi:hypothetical protein M3936_03115 [Sutcliffiella horikoshii]|uniref:hypothetical protein n=1 Tax=Sutcliffiella horikoshii TaxID=79883 RepID=UPI0007D0B7F0|nr:hypothetical protein [Sutcliffiella horikoshii]MCM3616565.1 hypothetical protein [Sutcliffiella horikoshii]
MKKLLFVLGILASGLLLSHSYNIYQEKKNLGNLTQWLENHGNKKFLFEENIDIMEVIHLGNDIYKVEAEGDKWFFIEYKKNSRGFQIQLYLEGNGMEMFLEYK